MSGKGMMPSKEGVEAMGGSEDTLFLLDLSGSMNDENDGVKATETKHAILMEAMEQMLRERLSVQGDTGDRTGVIRFGGKDGLPQTTDEERDVGMVFPLASVTEYTIARLHSIKPGGGTPMFKALKLAIEHLDRSARGLARLVIISDGQPTDFTDDIVDDLTSGTPTDMAAAQAALKAEQAVAPDEELDLKDFMFGLFAAGEECSPNEAIIRLAKKASDELGISIDTVGVSGKVESSYDGEFMKRLAEAGEGEFYEVKTKAEVANLLMKLERERRELLGHGMLLLGSGNPIPPITGTGRK